MSDYEVVHTITDWYDGARNGVADLNGKPHYYENHWNEGDFFWSDVYLLKPLNAETFELAMESWNIYSRWEVARQEGKASVETSPTLPEERERYDEIEKILAERFVVFPETSLQATAEFVYGQPTKVKWRVVEDSIKLRKAFNWKTS
ncbi:MAG: hypothetical protein WKF90_13020 [Pyrinomonadaceae bacterium]